MRRVTQDLCHVGRAACFSSLSAGSRLPDPHSVSHKLDAVTSERIVERLESRGRDAIFRSLFEGYFPRLLPCQHVLELGCGTGVLVRALAKHEGFKGRVTGSDQSPVFLDAARRFARREGCDMARVAFVESDASTADTTSLPGGPFDAVVMHTLISHVADPLEILKRAHGLAAPDSLLVVMDGDYSSLSYSNLGDPELGRAMDEALVVATFAQPDAMRQLPRLLPQAGWEFQGSTSRSVSEVGREASYWVSFARAYMPRVKQAELIPDHCVDKWWESQQAALKEGSFFAAASYHTFFAVKR